MNGDQMLQRSGVDSFEQLSRLSVAEMTEAASDTFFQGLRVTTCPQHFFIVIALEHKRRAIGELFDDVRGNAAGVGASGVPRLVNRTPVQGGVPWTWSAWPK